MSEDLDDKKIFNIGSCRLLNRGNDFGYEWIVIRKQLLYRTHSPHETLEVLRCMDDPTYTTANFLFHFPNSETVEQLRKHYKKSKYVLAEICTNKYIRSMDGKTGIYEGKK